MNKSFIKHLVAALIAVIAAYVSSVNAINWAYVGVYSLGYVLVYAAKNYVWPSKSPLGFINVWDLISGLLLAVGSAVVDLAAQWITTTSIDLRVLWATVSTTMVAYLLSKFGFGAKLRNATS